MVASSKLLSYYPLPFYYRYQRRLPMSAGRTGLPCFLITCAEKKVTAIYVITEISRCNVIHCVGPGRGTLLRTHDCVHDCRMTLCMTALVSLKQQPEAMCLRKLTFLTLRS